MNPTAFQSSIDCPLSGNTPYCPGFPLPRSFKHACHRIWVHGPFSGLLMAHQGPNRLFHGKRAYGPFWGISWDSLRRSNQLLLDLSSVRGNSRALVLAITRRNQTRILFVWDLVWAFFGDLVVTYQTEDELDVAYTVIRPHSLIGETFTLYNGYNKDFNSFCFTGKELFACILWTNLLRVLHSWIQH